MIRQYTQTHTCTCNTRRHEAGHIPRYHGSEHNTRQIPHAWRRHYSATSWSANTHRHLPAIHAVMKQATFPAIIALNTIRDRSLMRDGTMSTYIPPHDPLIQTLTCNTRRHEAGHIPRYHSSEHNTRQIPHAWRHNVNVYSTSWSANTHRHLPAIHAVMKQATLPAIIALNTIRDRSLMRDGAIAPRAPSIIPMEPMLEKPHRA